MLKVESLQTTKIHKSNNKILNIQLKVVEPYTRCDQITKHLKYTEIDHRKP